MTCDLRRMDDGISAVKMGKLLSYDLSGKPTQPLRRCARHGTNCSVQVALQLGPQHVKGGHSMYPIAKAEAATYWPSCAVV